MSSARFLNDAEVRPKLLMNYEVTYCVHIVTYSIIFEDSEKTVHLLEGGFRVRHGNDEFPQDISSASVSRVNYFFGSRTSELRFHRKLAGFSGSSMLYVTALKLAPISRFPSLALHNDSTIARTEGINDRILETPCFNHSRTYIAETLNTSTSCAWKPGICVMPTPLVVNYV